MDRDWHKLPLYFKILYEGYMDGVRNHKTSAIAFLKAQSLLEAKNLQHNRYFHDILDILDQIQPLDDKG